MDRKKEKLSLVLEQNKKIGSSPYCTYLGNRKPMTFYEIRKRQKRSTLLCNVCTVQVQRYKLMLMDLWTRQTISFCYPVADEGKKSSTLFKQLQSTCSKKLIWTSYGVTNESVNQYTCKNNLCLNQSTFIFEKSTNFPMFLDLEIFSWDLDLVQRGPDLQHCTALLFIDGFFTASVRTFLALYIQLF